MKDKPAPRLSPKNPRPSAHPTRKAHIHQQALSELGTLLLEGSDNDIVATRKVIDVSGDGPNNDGNPMQESHDKTIATGVVVNGLPVMDENANGYYPDLDKYYAGCVVGGKGAFVVVVKSFADFGAAMRHKLILEISQNESQIKQALEDLQPNQLVVRTAAERRRARRAAPSVAPDKRVSGGCDIPVASAASAPASPTRPIWRAGATD